MKKDLSTILTAVSCMLTVICLFQISKLNQKIGILESNVSNQVNQVRNEVNGISSNISTSMEDQASLLTDSSWEYGEANYDARTVELICSVSPKEYALDTEAVIVVGGIELPMTFSGGTFTSKIDIPLFEETYNAKVMLREGGVTRTEMLDWHLSPRYDYLLNAYANLDGIASGSPRNGVFYYERSGVITINGDSKYPNGVKAITLVEVMDGNELGRTNIPLDNAAFQEGYKNANGAKPELASATTQAVNGEYGGPFYYELDKDYEIPYSSTWMLYTEIVDSNGLLYRCVVDRKEISENGEPLNGDYRSGMEASIYDADGNALYEPDAELF